jgi:hypothetical protein
MPFPTVKVRTPLATCNIVNKATVALASIGKMPTFLRQNPNRHVQDLIYQDQVVEPGLGLAKLQGL